MVYNCLYINFYIVIYSIYNDLSYSHYKYRTNIPYIYAKIIIQNYYEKNNFVYLDISNLLYKSFTWYMKKTKVQYIYISYFVLK